LSLAFGGYAARIRLTTQASHSAEKSAYGKKMKQNEKMEKDDQVGGKRKSRGQGQLNGKSQP
jgi:hypothetical protein